MAIDLTGPTATVERVLFGVDADTFTVHRRPAAGATTFNKTTGGYTPPTPTLVYDGVGLARDNMTALAGRSEQGAVPATEQRWMFKFPISSPVFLPGDVITVVTSKDPRIAGRRWVIGDVGGGTYKVLRSVTATRWEPGGNEDWMAP